MCLPALLFVAFLAGRPPSQEDIVLFDAKTLAGWTVDGAQTFTDGGKEHPVWVVRDGMISCRVTKGSFGFLRYDRQVFKDFKLSLEYRFVAPAGKGRRGNSGIGIRTGVFDPKKSVATRPSYAAYEIQLLDDADRPASKGSTGSLYRYVAPSVQAAKPAPMWNSMEIECVGPRIRITLNDQKIIDVDQSTIPEIKNKPLSGYICLQNHGSQIDFRNIRVRNLSSNKK